MIVPYPEAGLPGQAERQGEVDEGLRGVGTRAVLFRTSGGQDHRRGSGGEGFDGLVEFGDRDPGDPLDPVGPVGGNTGLHCGEALGASGDVAPVVEVVA